MVGDWLKPVNSTPQRVSEIGSAFVKFKDGSCYTYDLVNQIPLSPEILEQYGWKKLVWNDVMYYPGISEQYSHQDLIESLRIHYRESTKAYSIAGDFIKIVTVADLQHVLKILDVTFVTIEVPICK